MKNLCIVLIALFLTGCVAHQRVTYFNDLSNLESGTLPIPDPTETVLKAGDIIEIDITSISRETNEFFMKPGSETSDTYRGNSYQIAQNGTVDIPLVGEVTVAGMTAESASKNIRLALLDYVQKPTVNVRLINFKITVLGEVENPGVYKVPTAQASVLEALGLAGDLTIYGRRDNVMLIRNNGGQKRFFRIDLNSSNLFANENYFLQNNDVIYVEPTKGITSKDDNIYRILPLVISSLTFVAVLVSLNQ